MVQDGVVLEQQQGEWEPELQVDDGNGEEHSVLIFQCMINELKII